MERLKYLIIGSGPAGIFAAEAIRMRDFESTITMVSEDRVSAHSPVMLTYWMAEPLSLERLLFRDPNWAKKNEIDFRSGSKVISLDITSPKIILENDHEIPYERLLIATGASPISLPLSGKESKGVTSFRYPADAERILKEGSGLREIVIIGGGFIGLKLACHLRERGLQVMVFEKESRLAARLFDLKASCLVKEKLEEKGIWVETDVEVIEVVDENGWVSGVRMKDGRIFLCQRVIQAAGVRPNTQFLIGSGIELNGGILVNERMETNVSGVYAAGDVTMTIDSITSKRVNNAIWAAATRQGTVAGSNIAGGDCIYVHNFYLNSMNLFGLQVMTAGHPYSQGESGVDILVEDQRESYRKIVIKDGRVIGFILIGDISCAGFLLSQMKRSDEITPKVREYLLGSGSFQGNLPSNLGFKHGLIFR